MTLTITQVDAFTDTPFRGNPAAVCILPSPRLESWMQQIAAEMNLAETAFLVRQDDGEYSLRWFTPTVEVDLCGHATLASAHVLWERQLLSADKTARFATRSGLLTAQKRGDWITLDFPVISVSPADAPSELLSGLKLLTSFSLYVAPVFVGRTRADYFLEVASEDAVRRLAPDFGQLATLGVQGVIVTARATTPGYDFVSRYFAPAVGIPEDPVTGSMHCALGPYWGAKLGKTEMVAYQASARGGVVRVTVSGERVLLGGQAVTVLCGELADCTLA